MKSRKVQVKICPTKVGEDNFWCRRSSSTSPIFYGVPNYTEIQAQASTATSTPEMSFIDEPGCSDINEWATAMSSQSPLGSQSPPLTRALAQPNQQEEFFDPAPSHNIHRDVFYKVTGWPKSPQSPETSSISIRSARSPTPKATQTVIQAQPRPTWHEYMSLWLAYEKLTRNAHTWACTECEYRGNIYQLTYVLKDNLKEEQDLELVVLSCHVS